MMPVRSYAATRRARRASIQNESVVASSATDSKRATDRRIGRNHWASYEPAPASGRIKLSNCGSRLATARCASRSIAR